MRNHTRFNYLYSKYPTMTGVNVSDNKADFLYWNLNLKKKRSNINTKKFFMFRF